MTTVKHRLTHTGNQIGLFLHRIAKGRLDGHGDATVLMLTCPRAGRTIAIAVLRPIDAAKPDRAHERNR